MIDFDFVIGKKVYFIGVLGVSMSRLALYTSHFTAVTGADRVYNERAKALEKVGIAVSIGSNKDAVAEADIIVYSSSIPSCDADLSLAHALGKVCIERKDYLGIVARRYAVTIAVAGSHGKSTTTAIIDNIFRASGIQLMSHIGADTVREPCSNIDADYFLTEACEYRRSFLSLHPTYAVVTGIDFDHPDEYSSMADIRSAFDEFMASSGVVICHESVGCDKAITYGYGEDTDYSICNISESDGKYDFDIRHKEGVTHISSPLYGRCNIENITAAFSLADTVGIDTSDIVQGIETFVPLRRRFECIGLTDKGARVILDYAHHPVEIERTIRTAHELTHGRVIVVFEPHTYSRTKSLIDGFLECFYWSDILILLPTFGAREVESDGYTTLDLLNRLNAKGEHPLYFDSYNRASRYLLETACGGDTVLVLGAGSVDNLGYSLINGEKNSATITNGTKKIDV